VGAEGQVVFEVRPTALVKIWAAREAITDKKKWRGGVAHGQEITGPGGYQGGWEGRILR